MTRPGPSPSRRGLGRVGARERCAYLGRSVALSWNLLCGARRCFAQLAGTEEPAYGVHVLADRVPVECLLDHANSSSRAQCTDSKTTKPGRWKRARPGVANSPPNQMCTRSRYFL